MDQPVHDRTRGRLGNQEKEPLRNPGLDRQSTNASLLIHNNYTRLLFRLPASLTAHATGERRRIEYANSTTLATPGYIRGCMNESQAAVRVAPHMR